MEKIYINGPGISRFLVEIARTPEELSRGLSYKESLPQRQGLLFAFPNVQVQSMWMPFMNFHLDIVWLDSNKQIVHINEDVAPCNGIHNCTSYSSNVPVLYAIELNAFDAQRIGLTVNMKLSFNVV